MPTQKEDTTPAASHVFTAEKGVIMFDQRVRFERANADRDTPDGQKRYSFTTDDEDLAARLRAVKLYGITEVPA